MNKTYYKLPYLLKTIIINVYGYILKRQRYTKAFFKILDEYLSIDKNESMCLNMIKIAGLTKDSRFYSINSNTDFFLSPIINKEIVKQNYDKIINKKEISTYLTTGGTTGSGLKYPISKQFIYHQWAVYWKFRKIHGLDIKTWCAYIMGKPLLNNNRKKPPYWIKDYLSRRLFLSLPHLNDKTVKLYLEKIKKENIHWIHGYPSVLNSFANLITDNKLRSLARELSLSCITTSSEMLLGYQKANIEDVFCCNVRQLYGLTEGVANIFECEYSSLHVDESFSFVEFIKDEENINSYHIIGTQYHNKAFPLIRYDTGDSVILDNDHSLCKCGRKSRVVKEIVGREAEYLLLADGRKIVRIGMLFAKAFNVKKAQIVQSVKGQADFFIVKAAGYSEKDEQQLVSDIINLLGTDFVYRIVYTDKLRTSSNGKIRLIINETDIDKGIIDSPINYVN